MLFLFRACLLSTSSCWFSLATWAFSLVFILLLPLCYCSTTSQRSAQTPTSSASSSTSPFLPLWPTWAYGRSDCDMSCIYGCLKCFMILSSNTVCVFVFFLDGVWGAEFHLGHVELLAAASVATCEGAHRRRRSQQQQSSCHCCHCGG